MRKQKPTTQSLITIPAIAWNASVCTNVPVMEAGRSGEAGGQSAIRASTPVSSSVNYTRITLNGRRPSIHASYLSQARAHAFMSRKQNKQQ